MITLAAAFPDATYIWDGECLRVPDTIRESVCFVGYKQTDEDGSFKAGGTGFFVSVSAEHGGRFFNYLVTARHCVDRVTEEGRNLVIRVNRKDGTAGLIEIQRDWYYPDNAADVAAMPLSVGGEWAVRPIHESMFLTSEEMARSMGIGDDLLVVGLFRHHHGNKKNMPVVRGGILAAIPEDHFIDNYGNEFACYIGEIRSLGGLSGSPVWVVHQSHSTRIPSSSRRREVDVVMPRTAYLLGLIRGHWNVKPSVEVDFLNDRDSVNAGMVQITPAQELRDLLDCDELAELRRKSNEEWRKQNDATLD